ncbi:hypothetical protein KC19_12G157200 [Ceratodon purpureus]|uniref:Response regulatory domain-containing protein n=1 Tax=Ceratodon purpureus TaxID=3225 RepID=A0A8T0G9W7_CERPU|nr:hypothetical protein KC19_12G157200 [Ceratodon purpureus]
MAADIATNSEDKACLTSGRLSSVESCVMEAMVQSVSNFEGKVEAGMHSAYNDLKPWKLLVPAERAKLPAKCVYKSRRLLQRICSGDRKVEANGDQLSSCENSCSEESRSEGPESDETSATSVPSISNSDYHVLAVDDSMVDQKVIERLLKTSSYKVTTVNSALRALEYLGLSESCSLPAKPNRVSVNLIMTDYCMPGMTGYDFLKIVKAESSAFKEVPVIVMSSENDSNRIKRCLAEGAKEFLIKPVQMADVKRLQGHIRSSAVSSDSSENSNSSICAKRKAPEGLQATSPVRRTRCNGVAVA